MTRRFASLPLLLALLAPSAAFGQSEDDTSTDVSTRFYDMDGAVVTGGKLTPPGDLFGASARADFAGLVHIERSFLSEIADTALEPSMR